MGKKLNIAFLWHMHQPQYKDFITGKYYLPWVRLHATYSYLDMISILDDFPAIRCTFNLTSSLMAQLEDFSMNRNVKDIYLALSLKDASELTDDEKVFILKNFFSCNPSTAIFPLQRYNELYRKRGSNNDEEHLRAVSGEFGDKDINDLQVLFNLVWCGFTLKNKDRLIKSLFAKGRGFNREDKIALLDKQREVVSSILPLYKKAQDEGRIEVSTTPFYHPILPLIYKMGSVKDGDCRKDAEWHVKKAVAYYKEVFGRRPVGMWPAEGAVSHDIIPVFAKYGIKWLATDEAIIRKTLADKGIDRDDMVFSPFTVSKGFSRISMLFRDVNISNDISFKYSGMSIKDAVDDFCNNMGGIKQALSKKKGSQVVSVILDGENPWPYYPDGGKGFLSGIYSRLSSDKGFNTVKIGRYLGRCLSKKRIKSLAEGSWINGDFSKWSGSPQKDKAWETLQKVREETIAGRAVNKKIMEELYVAESSDWFWWYDEFGTELNFTFDDLFRMHLKNIYQLSGNRAPSYLEEPIYTRQAPSVGPIKELMTPPVLDGKYSYGMEWKSAKIWKTKEQFMAMVKTDAVISGIGYGMDRDNIYLMIEPGERFWEGDIKDMRVEASFASPVRISVSMPFNEKEKGKISAFNIDGGKKREVYFVTFAFSEILEASIPFSEIGSEPGDEINFKVNILKNDDLVESWPTVGFFNVIVPGKRPS